MRWLHGLKSASLAAICIVGVVACGDDDKGDKLSDSGSPATADDGDGPQSGLDSGLDGSLPRDAATVSPDGTLIGAQPDGGTPAPENDASAPTACPAGCNDNVACTIDSCVNGACQHRVDNNACGAGTSCSLTMGCQPGKACASNADCEDMDGCTTRASCNMMVARCEYDVLDRDGDGYPPVSCGGTDCNDDRGRINPSAAETCDGVDNDCNGTVDDVKLAEGATCKDGRPGCADGYTSCGPLGCINLQTSNTSCGACGNPCIDGEVCTNGECTCPLGGSIMMCQDGPVSACA
ncbi:MAG TPA: putative metal-binding motif-containing protein, partial [Polyangiales bacterium]